MDTIIFRSKETGNTLRYIDDTQEIVATNYYIQTNIDSFGTAMNGMDGLLRCIDKTADGQALTISFNEKTRCYDISIALDEMLPEWLLFDRQQLLRVREMKQDQRKQIFETAQKRGREEFERYCNT